MSGEAELLDLPSWLTSNDYQTFCCNGIVFKPPDFVVKISGVQRALRIEHKKGAGVDGGNAALRGLEIERGLQVHIEVWTGAAEKYWNKVSGQVMAWQDPSGRRIVSVDHPQFSRYGLTQCLCQLVKEGTPHPGGALPVTLQFWENRVRTGSSVAKAKPDQAPSPPPTIDQPDRVPQVKLLRDVVGRPSRNPRLQ